MSKDQRLVDLTLSTVGDGEAEAQFQESLTRASEILTDVGRFRGLKDAKCEITVKVELSRNFETGFYHATVDSVKLKEPSRRAVTTGAFLRDGVFFVEEKAEQLSILRPPKSETKE